MNVAEFRKMLVRIMPGYRWTVHRDGDGLSLCATGIQSSGFNRLSTLQVERFEKADGSVTYTATSAGGGAKSRWEYVNTDVTLPRSLRGLQNYYEQRANAYRSLAERLEAGRSKAALDRQARP